MHDLRVFRDQSTDQWWVVQVLTAGSFGWGPGPHPPTDEGIFFTELGEREKPSLHARIPAGRLHRATHASLIHVLRGAKVLEGNVALRPANVPSADEFTVSPVSDDEGLRWVYRKRHLPLFSPDGLTRVESSVEFVCLDDSSLRGSIRMADEHTFDQLLSAPAGAQGLVSLIQAVKASFEDVSALTP